MRRRTFLSATFGMLVGSAGCIGLGGLDTESSDGANSTEATVRNPGATTVSKDTFTIPADESESGEEPTVKPSPTRQGVEAILDAGEWFRYENANWAYQVRNLRQVTELTVLVTKYTGATPETEFEKRTVATEEPLWMFDVNMKNLSHEARGKVIFREPFAPIIAGEVVGKAVCIPLVSEDECRYLEEFLETRRAIRDETDHGVTPAIGPYESGAIIEFGVGFVLSNSLVPDPLTVGANLDVREGHEVRWKLSKP